MNEIRIQELDPEVVSDLERRAREHGHSLGEEIKDILREHMKRERLHRDPVAWSRQIRAMTPKHVKQTDSLTLLREDRDR